MSNAITEAGPVVFKGAMERKRRSASSAGPSRQGMEIEFADTFAVEKPSSPTISVAR
jgi:hypothetical protein